MTETKCCDITCRHFPHGMKLWNQKTYLCSGEAINLQVFFKGETFFPVEQITSIVVDARPLWKSILTPPAPPLLLRWRSQRAQVRDGAIRAGWQKHGSMGNCFSFYAQTYSPTSSQSIFPIPALSFAHDAVFLWPLTYSTCHSTIFCLSQPHFLNFLKWPCSPVSAPSAPLLSPPADAWPAPLTLELSAWGVQELRGAGAKRGVKSFISSVLPGPLISCSADAFALTQLCLWRLFIVLFCFPVLRVSVWGLCNTVYASFHILE